METLGGRPKPHDWAYKLDDAIENLVRRAKVSKLQVANALGFKKHLSISTITSSDEWYERLCGAFAALRVPYVAAGLDLTEADYPLVETFFAEAVKALHGYDVDARLARADVRERIDWGVAGVELLARGSLREARPYLEHSWQAWRPWIITPADCPKDVTNADKSVMLRAGTELAVLDGLNGHIHARLLIDLTRAVNLCAHDFSDSQVRTAAGIALAQIGVGYRLLGSNDLNFLVGYSQRAVALLSSDGAQLNGRLCGLRDQAKPLVKAALSGTQPVRVSGLLTDAEAAFHEADDLAGGERPREETYEAWLLTRATWTECLAVAGRVEEAQRFWDTVLTQPWFEPLRKRLRFMPLRTKLLMTEMALVAGRGRLDELGGLARAFLTDPANVPYGERLGRAAVLEQYALTRDVRCFWKAILN